MARSLSLWVGGVALVCLAVGAVYLPPRGVPKWAEGRLYVPPPANQQRIRARELSGQWQEANADLQGALYHERIARSRSAETPRVGPTLALSIDDSLRAWAEPMLRSALDSAWQRLGIGESKVSVGILLNGSGPIQLKTTPIVEENRYGASYILPDSTNRSTCLVIARVPQFATIHRYIPMDQLANYGISILGPCAFYARFGVPGPRMEQWLGRRNFDVAISPRWDRPARFEDAFQWFFTLEDRSYWWYWLYSYPFPTTACFSGRADSCRENLAAGDKAEPGRKPRVVVPYDPWEYNKVRQIGSQVFLSEVFRTVGEERFQDLWTTTLPIDSALTNALHRPVGEYVVSWYRTFASAPKFGAAAGWLDMALGLAFAGVVVVLAMLGQARREVR